MLPEEYCLGFSEALGTIDIFTVRQSTVDVTYAFSALLSAAILGMLFGIQRQNTFRVSSSIQKSDKVFGANTDSTYDRIPQQRLLSTDV